MLDTRSDGQKKGVEFCWRNIIRGALMSVAVGGIAGTFCSVLAASIISAIVGVYYGLGPPEIVRFTILGGIMGIVIGCHWGMVTGFAVGSVAKLPLWNQKRFWKPLALAISAASGISLGVYGAGFLKAVALNGSLEDLTDGLIVVKNDMRFLNFCIFLSAALGAAMGLVSGRVVIKKISS